MTGEAFSAVLLGAAIAITALAFTLILLGTASSP